MKQTNNAIKFLMAQYRAIFKNAYFKGMATALVLTAGLATGAAQAEVSPTYTWNGTEWTKNEGHLGGGSGGALADSITIAAGAIAGDSLSGSSITDEKATSVATGGDLIITNSKGDPDVAADYNFKTISGSAFGGNAQGTGNVTAESNKVTVTGAGYVAKNTGNSGGAIIGGRAISAEGIAIARDNHIKVYDITAAANSGAAAGTKKGGYAEGAAGAIAELNSIEESGSEGSLLLIPDSVIAGHATAKGSAGGTFRAEGNSLDYDYTKVSGSATVMLVGGLAETHGQDATAKGDYFQSFNNTVTLNHSELVGNNSSTAPVLVIGNYVNNKDTTSTLSSVQGTEGTPSVHILNSSITSGGVFGGRISASGSATAQNNSVKLEDTTVTSGTGIMGASITSTLADQASATFNVTGNTVTISNSDTKAASAKTVESGIQGASITVSGNSGYTDLLNKVSITASNNNVEVGSNVNLTGDDSRIYGVLADVKSTSGSAVTLSNNSVTFNGKINDTNNDLDAGNIWGVFTNELGATATNNTVTVNGSITNGLVVGAQVANAAGTINKINNVDEVSTLTGNKIVIGADAVLSSTNIQAVSVSGSKGVVTGNSVEINGDVRNSALITGGAGADSVVTLAQGAELTSSTTSTTILSDVIDVDGKLTVSNGQDVTFAGYYRNGEDAAAPTEYNPNQTTISSSASVLNGGTINVYGTTSIDDNAKLHATSAASEIVIDGSKVNSTYKKENNDIKVDFVNKNNGTLVISSEKLKSYLTKGDQYQATANAAAVEDVAGL